jgi:hypothetical protein
VRDAHGEVGIGEPCGICGVTLTDDGQTKYALDHDHESGAIRGWLCIRCNAGIGNFDEEPERLRAGADYVARHRMLGTSGPPARRRAGEASL